MALGYIYEIIDKRKPDVSVYVGSTNEPLHRWAQHLCAAFQPSHSSRSPVHAYMKKEGPEHFDFRVLEECFWKDKVDLRKREQVWMDQRKPSHNRCPAYVAKEEAKRRRNETTKIWQAKVVVCECGMKLTQGSLRDHQKSTSHAQRLIGVSPITPAERLKRKNKRRKMWEQKQVACECGARLTQGSLSKHRRRVKHTKRMQEIALAKIKDGVRIHPRPVESPIGPELPCPASPERAARVEAQAEAVDGAREVPRARANHPPADSETG